MAGKNADEKRRQKENEEKTKQYNQLPPYLKKKLGERKGRMKKDEQYLRQMKRKLGMDMGNQVYATPKEVGKKVDAQSMVEAVLELGLKEEDLEGIQRDLDVIEIMLKEGVEIDCEEHNSNEENKYLINKVNDVRNTVKLRGLNMIKEVEEWREDIRKVLEPYAMEILSIEATKFTSKRLGKESFTENMTEDTWSASNLMIT